MKYFIHDHYGTQQTLIDSLPSGYTALDYEHPDTVGIIQSDCGIPIACIPGVVTQLSMQYTNTPTVEWICVPIGHCTNWTEVQAALTLGETEQAEAWERHKQWLEDNGHSIPE